MSIRLAVLALVAAICSACGYSTGSQLPDGVQRIAVEAFGNDTEWRGAEIEFTRVVGQELSRRAGAALVAKRSADAVLRGRITEVRRTPLAEGRDNLTIEDGVAVAVEFTLENPRSGAVICGPFRVIRRAEALTARNEAPQDALLAAARLCARDAVDRICAEDMKRVR